MSAKNSKITNENGSKHSLVHFTVSDKMGTVIIYVYNNR